MNSTTDCDNLSYLVVTLIVCAVAIVFFILGVKMERVYRKSVKTEIICCENDKCITDLNHNKYGAENVCDKIKIITLNN
ncbi:hypothetical protein [Acanthamoeba castellanii mimivirus]|jgi:hypothetical protein|uniref:Uncharacterized protein n=4 Tax=Mimivirus TaxID=315393 RepID=E3VZ27_MIMIV|nr:hypothetical protein MIMI_gp0212 [Acanthamoeba polyphaga mimivirus]AEQ60372.1 hypothetical protein [Acanthamoeba castellanii mamavirus]AHA45683.1 hypothetical protein HIRU_S777 [Hirudovirus strain Sangsue]QTF49095.1 hypothetical protein [Mimivirus reunion]WMV61538.1 hypothetical protein qu_200 [Mimivirus sp.]BAV61281.1 hypothetical protein [Acanthamoeba castellanii mimivirus]